MNARSIRFALAFTVAAVCARVASAQEAEAPPARIVVRDFSASRTEATVDIDASGVHDALLVHARLELVELDSDRVAATVEFAPTTISADRSVRLHAAMPANGLSGVGYVTRARIEASVVTPSVPVAAIAQH